MKASRFSEAQEAFILKQGSDGCRWPTSAARPVSARRPTSIGRSATMASRFFFVVVLHSRALVLVRSTDNVRSIPAARRVAVPSGSLSSQPEQVTVAAAAFLVRTGRFKGPRAFA